jgi:hypothetical protein
LKELIMRTLAVVAVLLLASCERERSTLTPRLALEDVTILAGPGLVRVENGTVLIEGGRIVCAGTGDECSATDDHERIDAAGTFLIPGLFDSHVHVAEYSTLPHAPLYLAHGITAVRDVGGRADSSLALRRRWQDSTLGPNLFLAGNPIDGNPVQWPAPFPDVPISVSSPEEARAAVNSAAANGVDFIKLYYGLDHSSLEAAIAEAHANGLKATADLTGWRIPTLDAINAGIDGLEHFLPELGPGTGMPGWPGGNWEDNAEQLEAIAREMAASAVTLTITTGLMIELFQDSFPSAKPTYAVLPQEMKSLTRTWWDASRSSPLGGLDSATRRAVWTQFSEATCRFARILHDAGGQILLGTDSF